MTENASTPSQSCRYEDALEQALISNHWDRALRTHVATCPLCSELELVAESLKTVAARDASSTPDPNLLWWRAQVRTKEESMRRATRPIHVLERFAIPALAVGGLALAAGLWPSISSSLAILELPRSQITSILLASMGVGVSMLLLLMTFGIALVWAEDGR